MVPVRRRGIPRRRTTRAGEVSYTNRGSNKAYEEFEQPVPKGFERLGLWPVETFESISPPQIGRSNRM